MSLKVLALATLKLKLFSPPGVPGENSFSLNTERLTPDSIDILAEKLTDLKLKHSVFGKYPIWKDETVDDWSKRIQPTLQEDNKRKEEEGAEEYLKRSLFAVDNKDKMNFVFDTLNALAETFGQPEITRDIFRKTSYTEVKGFITAILSVADISTKDFENQE